MPCNIPPAEAGDQFISQVLATFPQAVTEFIARRMACPGCPMAKFETMAEAARNYGMDPRELLAAIAVRFPKQHYMQYGKEVLSGKNKRAVRPCQSH